MKLRAACTLLTVSHQPECFAIRSRGVDTNVGETTVVLVATTVLEVLTRRCVVGCGRVGKKTSIILRAFTLEQPALADSLLLRIVKTAASLATAETCS